MPYDAKTLSAYTHKANQTNEDSPRIVDCDACSREYPIDQTQAIETHAAPVETPADYTTICDACAAPSVQFAATIQRYTAAGDARVASRTRHHYIGTSGR